MRAVFLIDTIKATVAMMFAQMPRKISIQSFS
nr:MAG TPA: hypothetical protein [Bacteriophage sp.]